MSQGKTRIGIFGSAGRMGQAIATAVDGAGGTHAGIDIGGDAAAMAWPIRPALPKMPIRVLPLLMADL